jgi:cation:H+ antiporter
VGYSSGILSKTKLSGSFVGIVLISIITSIPELISQIVQSSDGKPDVAISNDLGSNAITTLVMAVSSLFLFRSAFLKNIKKDSVILTIITLSTTIAFTIALFFGKDIRIGKTNVFLIGLVPIILLIIYIGMTIYTYYIEKKEDNSTRYKYHNKSHSLTKII